MKISSQQIEELYKFTRQHFVEHYDVQTELVDHLANDIEHIWTENPSLSFEEARDKSFKKFGVFGFMDVYEARMNSLNKKYLKLVWSILRDYFKIPQILFTIALFCLIYTAYVYIPNQSIIYYVFAGVFFVVIIWKLFLLHKIKKQRFKQTGKKWILEEYILNAGNLGAFSYVYFQIPLQLKVHLDSIGEISLLSAFFTLFFIVTYIIVFVLPSKIDTILSEQYPEYKLVN